MKSKHLLNRTNSITVTVSYEEEGEKKEDALNVRHRVLTPELWAKIKPGQSPNEQNGNGQTKDTLVTEMLELLTEWDVEGEDGQPLPINEDTLGRIDYVILKEINRAIFAYTFPNVTT